MNDGIGIAGKKIFPICVKYGKPALCIFGTEQIKAYMPDYSCGRGETGIRTMLYHSRINGPYINLIMI